MSAVTFNVCKSHALSIIVYNKELSRDQDDFNTGNNSPLSQCFARIFLLPQQQSSQFKYGAFDTRSSLRVIVFKILTTMQA